MRDPGNQRVMDEAVVKLDVAGAQVGLTSEETEAARAEMDRYGRSLGPAVASGRMTMAKAKRLVVLHADKITAELRRKRTVSA